MSRRSLDTPPNLVHRGVMSTPTIPQATVVTTEQVAGTPEQPLGSLVGVANRVLWTNGVSMAGVLTVQGGHRLGAHTHRAHDHHYWVVEGGAAVLGEEVGPGSYAYIPAGTEHDIDASHTDGCSVFYLYVS